MVDICKLRNLTITRLLELGYKRVAKTDTHLQQGVPFAPKHKVVPRNFASTHCAMQTILDHHAVKNFMIDFPSRCTHTYEAVFLCDYNSNQNFEKDSQHLI